MDHSREDGEGEFGGREVGDVFGEVLDCGDDGLECRLIGWGMSVLGSMQSFGVWLTATDKNRSEIVVEDHHEEA